MVGIVRFGYLNNNDSTDILKSKCSFKIWKTSIRKLLNKTWFYPERLIKKDFWSNGADLKMEYPVNPPFIEKAAEEQNERAEKTFNWANEVEQIHYNLFQDILKAVKEKKAIKNEPYYVCPLCGNTVAGQAPDKCPICGTAGSKFKKID